MQVFADAAVALLVALGPAIGLVRSLPDPVAFERRYRERMLANPSWSMRRDGLRMLLLSPLFYYAYLNANLSLLWASLAALLAPLGLIALLVSFTEYTRWYKAPGAPPSELDPALLRRSRRRTQVVQAAFLAAWAFGWRHIGRLAV